MNEQNEELLPAAAVIRPPCAREIDVLIAANVMGLLHYKDEGFLPHQGWYSLEDDPARDWAPGDKGPHWGVLPEYSVDPSASKELLAKMIADGWRLEMWARESCAAKFWGLRRTEKAYASELAMAVALAALNAFGVDWQQGASADAPPQANKEPR